MNAGHRRENEARTSDAAYNRWVGNLAKAIGNIDGYRRGIQEDAPTLTSFLVKCDPDDEGGVLVVAKGYEGSQWKVAFHRGDSVEEALKGLGDRLQNRSLKWRDDEPYDANRGER